MPVFNHLPVLFFLVSRSIYTLLNWGTEKSLLTFILNDLVILFFKCQMVEFYGFNEHEYNVHTSCLLIFCSVQLGIGIGDWWPVGFSTVACGSLRRSCEQSQHSKIDCTSAALQAPWHCGPRTSKSHRAVCALFSSCSHNQHWASRPGPWISCALYCLWVSASYT